ncbi:hypothetical protein [Paenibacillus sp. RU5A]|nr:hypothetical protein [Paenibacillus sp. RU5A]
MALQVMGRIGICGSLAYLFMVRHDRGASDKPQKEAKRHCIAQLHVTTSL